MITGQSPRTCALLLLLSLTTFDSTLTAASHELLLTARLSGVDLEALPIEVQLIGAGQALAMERAIPAGNEYQITLSPYGSNCTSESSCHAVLNVLDDFDLQVTNHISGETLAALDLKIPVPNNRKTKVLYVNLDQPDAERYSIESLKKRVATDTWGVYFKAQRLHGESVAIGNRDLAVASAYLWFQAAYIIATGTKTYDVVAMDKDATAQLEQYLEIARNAQTKDEKIWRRAWSNYFRNTSDSFDSVGLEIAKARLSDWKLYQYLGFYWNSAMNRETCRLFAVFAQRYESMNDDTRNDVASWFGFGSRQVMDLSIRQYRERCSSPTVAQATALGEKVGEKGPG
jgi:hypothetical protein